MMKKLLTLLVVLAMILSLASCDKDSEKPKVTTPESSTDTTASDTTAPDTTDPDSTTDPDATTVPGETTDPNGTTVPDGTTTPDGTTVPGGTTAPDGTTTPGTTPKPPVTTDPEPDPEPNEGVTYTGMAGAQEIEVTILDGKGTLLTFQREEMPADMIEELGLNGSVTGVMVVRVEFGSAVVKNGILTLSDDAPKMYQSARFEGTAAEEYIAIAKAQYKSMYESGDIDKAEYDMMMVLLNGEEAEMDEDDRVSGNMSAQFKLNDVNKTCLALKNESTDGEDIKYIWECEYTADGKATKEINYEIDGNYYDAMVIIYRPDGKTVKAKERYDLIVDDKTGEYELGALESKSEYREDGTETWTRYNEDGSYTVIEYDENGRIIKETEYDKNGNEITEGDSPIITPPDEDEIPIVDFEGQDFRVSTRRPYGNMEVVVDDETSSSIIDQAMMLRNAKIEDEYNVVIKRQDNDASAYVHTNRVLTDCVMQADTFDLAMTYVYESAPLVTNGFVLNWNYLKYTDLDASYWFNGENEKFAVRDAVYTAMSKMCVSTIGNTVAMFYNRDLADEWKGEDFSANLIDKIYDGDWTYDELMKIANEFGQDDSTADDACGLYMTRDWSIDTWHAAWEIPVIKNSDENGLEDVYMTDRLLTYANRMHTMYYDTPAISYGTQNEALTAFTAGKALFTTGSLSYAQNSLADTDIDYLILPQPKFDDKQSEYHSAMFDNYSVMSIPLTADADFVSIIVEALSAASEEYVYPAYKEDILRGQTDPGAEAMFDIVFENITWDIATLLHPNVRLMDMVRVDVLTNPDKSYIQETYNAKKDDIQDYLDEIMSRIDEFYES